MRTHNKTMSYLGAVALVIGAASPTFAQQTAASCMAEIAQAQAQIARAQTMLAGGLPTPADPLGPGSGAGRQLAQGPSPANPGNPISGADRTLAAGLPTPADPLGPGSGAGRMTGTVTGDNNPSGAGRQLAGGLPTPADPLGPGSGAGRELAAGMVTGSSGQNARIQEAQALVGAAQTACNAGDTVTGVAKARQAVNILQ